MTDGLLRQRRNLMALSLTIIFLRFGGVSISKVSLFGTEFLFNNIQALYAAIWLVFFYFLMRFYQYFMQESNKGIVEEFNKRLDGLCFTNLMQDARKQHSIEGNMNGTFQISKLKRISFFRREGEVGRYISRELDHERLSLVYKVHLLKYIRQYLVASIHMTFQRSHLTDYFLPFIVAVFALLYGLAGKWQGALFNVIKSGF